MKVNFKKSIIKGIVFGVVFATAMFVISTLMNRNNYNTTMDMSEATLPIVTMQWKTAEGEYLAYNELHGHHQVMEVAFQRDSITALGEDRDTYFSIDLYGAQITRIEVELRSVDGSRLIEKTTITEYQQVGDQIQGRVELKDLLEADTEYAMSFLITMNEQVVRYYTRVIWSIDIYMQEKLQFVQYFHQNLYDKEAARNLTMYMESDATGDNSSFHHVDIHSSFQMMTWGKLHVHEVTTPMTTVKELIGKTASFVSEYIVQLEEEETLYQVREYYRIRYTPGRVYLLDFDRIMTQIPGKEENYRNDKILLGIVDENTQIVESADGGVIVYIVAGKLMSFNVATNKATTIFSFYDEANMDARARYTQHDIKILDVNEGGNVTFAVYGYMNRGRHEGEVGLLINHYNNATNTVEEVVYIPYMKSYEVLLAEMDRLLFMNREGVAYIFMENSILAIDTINKIASPLMSITQDDTLRVSDNHNILVWQDGERYQSKKLTVMNLSTAASHQIDAGVGEVIRPLGFMGEDIIYGVAKESDLVWESTDNVFFPMYKICIENVDGELLKVYQQDQNQLYAVSCSVVDNQIIIEQVRKNEDGVYEEAQNNQITNNIEKQAGKTSLEIVITDTYAKYVQIKLRNTIDEKSLKIATTKEVMFEGSRELVMELRSQTPRYYVYGAEGVDTITNEPSIAVNLAYPQGAVVINEQGLCIWNRANRDTRVRINEIVESAVSEETGSLAVCLEAMLSLEGVPRNAQYLLNQNNTALQILAQSLDESVVLNLSGCDLDAILYYVNQRTPVLASLEDGNAVLIVGYNEFNIYIMEPTTGRIYQKGKNDSASWFAEQGNRFLTYVNL
ncbi:MAG: hypothetical protein LBM60_00135 [Clostridium sp.]|nr:hypothetical protein [Clostridium sp.]